MRGAGTAIKKDLVRNGIGGRRSRQTRISLSFGELLENSGGDFVALVAASVVLPLIVSAVSVKILSRPFYMLGLNSKSFGKS